MDPANGTTKNNQVLFSIGSYKEREKRVIKKITANSIFSSFAKSSALRENYPTRTTVRERPSSMFVTDSVKLYNTLPNPPKARLDGTIRDPILRNGQLHSSIEKPTCPPTSQYDDSCTRAAVNGSPVDKPNHPPKLSHRSLSLEPEQLRNTGKVALTIVAYEGEPRTPTRLEFLPPQPMRLLSRSSSKASSSDASSPQQDTVDDGEPIGSRLQNELVATLKRSNLRKKTDALQENGEEVELSEDDRSETTSEKSKDNIEISNGNVKQLAIELDKQMLFRINPENGEENSDKKV